MCGRFTLTISKEMIESELGISISEYRESYNIAPTQSVLGMVGSDHGYRSGYFRWGLIPSWAKDASIGSRLINARSETIDEKRSFQPLLSRRRCAIIADSFYEWKREDGKKVPYRIMLNDKKVFTFAGLWDRWVKDGEEMVTCTILTTEPNNLMSEIHDRMPVILDEQCRELWLDPAVEDKELLKSILKPYDAEEMSFYQVSADVNNPRNNEASLIESV
ncbi:Putative SOS response-associated peptidase YedK [Gracilibacillus ureilyticus]|uniref:Abasic site processing protein n=1 Tax=Gracilibacillus ureilyticus TaxID=531814 RepID=A0A1H9NED2_9BACI|nr:SOS response-associated peptidase [Gracilibacillus ureilyticus]SER34334.1 Putative SOS response-associated peptidase YedK [Gracilibacillus ureilyticus]